MDAKVEGKMKVNCHGVDHLGDREGPHKSGCQLAGLDPLRQVFSGQPHPLSHLIPGSRNTSLVSLASVAVRGLEEGGIGLESSLSASLNACITECLHRWNRGFSFLKGEG